MGVVGFIFDIGIVLPFSVVGKNVGNFISVGLVVEAVLGLVGAGLVEGVVLEEVVFLL